MPLVQDGLLDLLTSSPACYPYASDAPIVNTTAFARHLHYYHLSSSFWFFFVLFQNLSCRLLWNFTYMFVRILLLVAILSFFNHSQNSYE